MIVALDASGHVYISGFNNGAVRRIGPTGVDLGDIVTGLAGAEGLAFDSDGNLYVSEYVIGEVKKFSPSGEALGTFASDHLDEPYGIAFDRAGRLYVANYASGTIHRVSSSGEDLGPFVSTGLDRPRDLVLVDTCDGDIVTGHDFTEVCQSFTDVPPSHIFWPWIEALLQQEITAGCSINPARYCPDSEVTRGQMAVFLLRGIHGAGYQPPAVSDTRFADVPATHPFARWIEELAAEAITAGCGINPLRYCPEAAIDRGQMAVFLLRARHGAGYQPPAATGIFQDVPNDHPFVRWIEQLAREGITGGCGTSPALYCPSSPVTRGQMAVFLVRAFQLPM
jgi:hypothetical protein